MNYLYLYGGALGETVFGAHLAQSLQAHIPAARLLFLSTRENSMAHALVTPLPFASYIERSKSNILAWFFLGTLLVRPHRVLVHEPLTGKMPLWWKCILRAATFRDGSIEVHLAPRSTISHIPSSAKIVSYNPAQDQIFDTVPDILTAWNIPVPKKIPVHLASSWHTSNTEKQQSILFHFFAPSAKRSIPLEKAKEILSAAQRALPGYTLLLTTDRLHEQEAKEMAKDTGATVLSSLSFTELVERLTHARVYVGVDTGITHLACAMGIPSVVVGNRSNPCWLPSYAPQAQILVESKNCICRGDKTGECFYEVAGSRRFRCMMDIETEAVISAVERTLTLNYV